MPITAGKSMMRDARHKACFAAGGMCGKTNNHQSCTLPLDHKGMRHAAHNVDGDVVWSWVEVPTVATQLRLIHGGKDEAHTPRI